MLAWSRFVFVCCLQPKWTMLQKREYFSAPNVFPHSNKFQHSLMEQVLRAQKQILPGLHWWYCGLLSFCFNPHSTSPECLL